MLIKVFGAVDFDSDEGCINTLNSRSKNFDEHVI